MGENRCFKDYAAEPGSKVFVAGTFNTHNSVIRI